jgi:histidine triad (HIT) family protein
MVRGEENDPWSGQADVVYRDAKTTAWVKGRWWENSAGAVVVVPNTHVENIYALDRELAADIHETARRIAFAMKAASAATASRRVSTMRAGGMQEVWHYHLHVFPRRERDDLYGSSARLSSPEERAPYVSALRKEIAERTSD